MPITCGCGAAPSRRSGREQVDALWQLCGLAEGARVLDAPCGYGRLSRLLADRGAVVLGVDQSPDLLAEAERGRGRVESAWHWSGPSGSGTKRASFRLYSSPSWSA
jgi:SAM-dependent methyltransferase